MSDLSPKDPQLRSVPQTAHHLNCSVRKVWHLLSIGALKSVRIGRAVRISNESIEQFIKNGGYRA